MRGSRHWVLASLLLVGASGCQGMSSNRRIARSEPPLTAMGDDGMTMEGVASGSGTAVAGAPASRPVTVVDRHPMLSKPREYYESSGNNKLVKAAAATFIGVPAGIVGEMKQIVVGQPKPVGY